MKNNLATICFAVAMALVVVGIGVSTGAAATTSTDEVAETAEDVAGCVHVGPGPSDVWIDFEGCKDLIPPPP